MDETNAGDERPFTWQTNRDGVVAVDYMEDAHLFHAARMLFNAAVPSEFEIPGCKKWTITYSKQYQRAAFKAMLVELALRDGRCGLSGEAVAQLLHMQTTARRLGLISGAAVKGDGAKEESKICL